MNTKDHEELKRLLLEKLRRDSDAQKAKEIRREIEARSMRFAIIAAALTYMFLLAVILFGKLAYGY